MKKVIALFTLILFSNLIFAQETIDPKVGRKTSSDTYINKIVLESKYTVVSMKYVSKSIRQQLDEFFRDNPKQKELLEELDSDTRRIYLERLAMQMQQGGNSISFQPSSYLRSKDGRRFKFIKASSIPVSPDNIIVEPDKRYYFKVYFERLDPGIEEVDIIEGEKEQAGGVSFWNFYGVEVNNPPTNQLQKPIIAETDETEQPEKIEPNAVTISLSGKVLDSETNLPLAAKIVCIAKDSNVKFDSLRTSRSGVYMFEVSPDDYLYEVSAAGYKMSEESFDLSNLKSSKSFVRNFYLEPIEENKSVEEEVTEVKPVISGEPESTASPIEVEKNTFRLNKVYFNLGEANLLPESFEQLDGLATMMKNEPTMQIQVIGHTDNQGDSKLNKKLSLSRAFNVREYLIDQGIDGKRIKFKGVGGDFPIAPNNTEENRQLNRRVEFVLLDK